MGKKAKDLSGMKFDTRTVLRRDGFNRLGIAMWRVHCTACGKESRVAGYASANIKLSPAKRLAPRSCGWVRLALAGDC
jgi:hypothetical protein